MTDHVDSHASSPPAYQARPTIHVAHQISQSGSPSPDPRRKGQRRVEIARFFLVVALFIYASWNDIRFFSGSWNEWVIRSLRNTDVLRLIESAYEDRFRNDLSWCSSPAVLGFILSNVDFLILGIFCESFARYYDIYAAAPPKIARVLRMAANFVFLPLSILFAGLATNMLRSASELSLLYADVSRDQAKERLVALHESPAVLPVFGNTRTTSGATAIVRWSISSTVTAAALQVRQDIVGYKTSASALGLSIEEWSGLLHARLGETVAQILEAQAWLVQRFWIISAITIVLFIPIQWPFGVSAKPATGVSDEEVGLMEEHAIFDLAEKGDDE